jgi:hypothetical protein
VWTAALGQKRISTAGAVSELADEKNVTAGSTAIRNLTEWRDMFSKAT